MILGMATSVYFLLGILIALLVDRAQMKEHVPYADFPAILRLEQIRVIVFLVIVLLGPAAGVKILIRKLYREITKG